MAVLDTSYARSTALQAFVKRIWPQCGSAELKPLSGDASLRRYFRIGGRVAVDAPPQTQKNAEFIDIASRLRQVGLRGPHIFAADLGQGFMLLEDVGDRVFAGAAQGTEQERYYLKAAALLPQLAKVRIAQLPRFDEAFMQQELDIMRKWLLSSALQLQLSATQQHVLDTACTALCARISAMPYCAMHRDFHCRNLQVLPDDSLCVLDFQDMVVGPCAYDVASLVYDCYVKLPQALIDKLIVLTWRRYQALGVLSGAVSLYEFKIMVLCCALQRHLKVLGIFNRLLLRDGKRGYLKDLPRVMNYTLDECVQLSEFAALGELLQSIVVPALTHYLQGQGIQVS